MSPPLLGVEEEGQINVSSPPVECISQNNQELRLGLPGSQSPERDADLCLLNSSKLDEKPLFPLLPSKDGICSSSQKIVVTGYKRGFCDTMDGFSPVKGSLYIEKDWMFCRAGSESQPVGHGNSWVNVMSARSSGVQASVKKGSANVLSINVTNLKQTGNSNHNSNAHVVKAQIVGWTPIRSFRTKTLTTSSKNSDEIDGKPGLGALFVKASMNGALYLRKVDLRTYSTYRELSSALEKMLSCFTLSPCESHGAS
ncbi:Auxin-responsive protein IAA9 [Hibiscus syriacus]|uniref:Auxin-responsive protein n=1 Tax=Hibiscus syriacus TaxID=106335 RepID=A0A6A3AJQ5_HIBSY|nr:Auxin-responsive protein IAA9 [Hibiscus syriacus]